MCRSSSLESRIGITSQLAASLRGQAPNLLGELIQDLAELSELYIVLQGACLLQLLVDGACLLEVLLSLFLIARDLRRLSEVDTQIELPDQVGGMCGKILGNRD